MFSNHTRNSSNSCKIMEQIRLSQTKKAFSFWQEASNGQKLPKIISKEISLQSIILIILLLSLYLFNCYISKLLGREGASLDLAPAVVETLLYRYSIDLLYCRESKFVHRQQLCQEITRIVRTKKSEFNTSRCSTTIPRANQRGRGVPNHWRPAWLVYYFKWDLYDTTHCSNKTCNCLSILLLPGMVAAIASYLVLFERKPMSQQDSILLG